MDDKLGAAIYCPHITSIWNVNNYNNKKRTIHGGDSNHNDCLRGRRRINLLYLVLAGPDKEFKICFRDDNFITTYQGNGETPMWQSTFVVFHLDRCSIPGAMQGAIIPFLTCRESLPPVRVGENTRLISIPSRFSKRQNCGSLIA